MSIADAKNIDYGINNDDEVFDVLGKILDSVNAEEQELRVSVYMLYISYI